MMISNIFPATEFKIQFTKARKELGLQVTPRNSRTGPLPGDGAEGMAWRLRLGTWAFFRRPARCSERNQATMETTGFRYHRPRMIEEATAPALVHAGRLELVR
jgi:hypothetical protein